MQRIWIVSELYYPEETSTGYYLTRIAEGLAGKFDVRVLCAQPNYSQRGVRAPRREIHNKVEIYRLAGTTLPKNVVLWRIINMLTFSLAVFFRALVAFRRGDLTLVVTNPPSLPFIVALAARLKGAPYTLLIHDLYPEILIASNKTRADSWLVKILDRANSWLYSHAAKIIVIGRDMKKLIEQKLNGRAVAIVTIPNWAELEQVEPRPRETNKMLAELKIEKQFVLLYAGNMGYPNDLESIIWCAEKLVESGQFHFVFLGSGVKKSWLEQIVAEKNLANVLVLPPRPRSEQIDFLNACDVALVSLVARMRGVSMPSRTYNILAAGKPIIAVTDDDSELALIVREEHVGWTVPPGAQKELLAAIIAAARLPLAERAAMGARARRAALEKYSPELALTNYLRIFDDQVDARRRQSAPPKL